MSIYSRTTIPARHFVKTLAANVDNATLTDEAFRELVRNTLPIVTGGKVKTEE